MADENKTEVVEETTVVEETKTVEPEKQPTRKELLRDLSKEFGINLFDAKGIEQFKEFQANQKTDLEKAQEVIDSYKTKEAEWGAKKLEYESKLKASQLGIDSENLEDALKLANNNPDNLEEVLKKYPMFKSKKGVSIGLTNSNNNNTPNDMTEAELYMKNNPQYRDYLKKK